MGLNLGEVKIKRFADGEIYVQLQESVRGCDVFLVQPTCPPANENLMELLIMIDACRRASAKTITAVIPYFGYARADRKVRDILYKSRRIYGKFLSETKSFFILFSPFFSFLCFSRVLSQSFLFVGCFLEAELDHLVHHFGYIHFIN